MALLDKLRSLLKSQQKLDVASRFERVRSSVSGTMSNFQVARDRELDRIVGLKICDAEKVALFENRFRGLKKPSEGEIAMRMKHPQVVETYEYGLTNRGEPYLVMEFIDGPGLQSLIHAKAEERLAGRRVALIRQMAEAIRYVHESGFIHRDVCPRNFIVTADMQTVKLIDFGLTVPAKPEFMQPGNRTGTPLYMAPEVVRRRPTDQRLDIFAFGVSCYALCTFEYPWPVSDTTGRAALQHDTDPPTEIRKRRPELNATLSKAIMKCLEPNVQARMPSMASFLQSIQPVATETEPSASPE